MYKLEILPEFILDREEILEYIYSQTFSEKIVLYIFIDYFLHQEIIIPYLYKKYIKLLTLPDKIIK